MFIPLETLVDHLFDAAELKWHARAFLELLRHNLIGDLNDLAGRTSFLPFHYTPISAPGKDSILIATCAHAQSLHSALLASYCTFSVHLIHLHDNDGFCQPITAYLDPSSDKTALSILCAEDLHQYEGLGYNGQGARHQRRVIAPASITALSIELEQLADWYYSERSSDTR